MNEIRKQATCLYKSGTCCRVYIVCLISINVQKKILKNSVFTSTHFFLDVY